MKFSAALLVSLVALGVAVPMAIPEPAALDARAPEEDTVDLVSTRSEWIYLKDKRAPEAAPDALKVRAPAEDTVDLVSTRSEWIYLKDKRAPEAAN